MDIQRAKSANGDIKSSLERINEHYLEIRCKREKENDIIKHFQRRAHLYIPSPPKISNYIEWLALIQHYGGPTRLVDFTYSIYIATYFAVEESDCDAAVWALRMNCIPKNPCHDVSKKSFNIMNY